MKSPRPAQRFRASAQAGARGILWAAVLALAGLAWAGERVDFNSQVRPLLSDRCFTCHGPDEASRKARLRLDLPEGALATNRAGKPIIKPGDPDASELVRRIFASDPEDRMPPPESKLALSADERAVLRRWVAEGAEYQDHWAFRHVQPVAVPPAGAGWARNEIDAFIAERLRREGWPPAPEASRETLIRRVSLDLTGLPPSPAEVDEFLADRRPDAYERLVDHLLASPHYGEWMAVEWMDLARFADTFGYQADVDMDLSPWRDWVIGALNRNLPWDEFLTWQLAGDLLPNPNREQILATAFNRLHRQTNEGGSIEEEFRAEYVADRVHTFGTAMLGLTLECARCHDHKYDPISQRDYYRLAAFFNSIDESGLYSHFTRATPTPVLLLWPEGHEERHAELQRQIAETEARLRARREASPAPEAPPAEAAPVTPPRPVVALSFETISDQHTPDAAGTNVVELHDGPVLVDGVVGRAMQFDGDNFAVVKGAGVFRRTDPFSFSLWLRPAEAQARAVVFHGSRAWTDSGSRGYELVLDHGRPWFALIHFWPGNALAVRARDPLPLHEWTHLAVTYDGSSRAAGVRLYRNGREMPTEVVRDHLYKDIRYLGVWGDSDVGNVWLTLAGRFRDSGFKGGQLDEFQVFDTELTAAEVAHLAAAGKPAPAPDAATLAVHRRVRADAVYQRLLSELRSLREAEDDLVTPVREIMVMRELPEPRPTYVLRRGAYDAPGERVERGTPERVFAFPPEWPRNRLGLARWVTDPRHPLTARVAVNRIWKLHFGRGLVATSWDFGAQGQLPSHPELLDWLAKRFVDSGWDRKALHRLIVLSATYRQSSSAAPELLARDPDNRLLARGPKHRLAAEQIRDSALAISGLLNRRLGGPSVKPYQPAGVWEESGTGKTYTQDTGDKLYRRSLYTFWRRTAPPPSMLTFDATSRESCTAKRELTTTPLQALVLLNDPQFLEAARVLGGRLFAQHPGDCDALIREAFRRVVCREPDPRECEILRRLYEEQAGHFRHHPGAAEQYLAIGEHPRTTALPAPDVAAAAVLVSALMNHDEFVMKR